MTFPVTLTAEIPTVDDVADLDPSKSPLAILNLSDAGSSVGQALLFYTNGPVDANSVDVPDAAGDFSTSITLPSGWTSAASPTIAPAGGAAG